MNTIHNTIPHQASVLPIIIILIIFFGVIAFARFYNAAKHTNSIKLLKILLLTVNTIAVIFISVNTYNTSIKYNDAVHPKLSNIINKYGLTEITKPRDNWSGETTPAYMDMNGKSFYSCKVLNHKHDNINDVRLACDDDKQITHIMNIVSP